jgi:hypothetical protein
MWIVCGRVATWFLFKPKIPILEHFGGPRSKNVDILWHFGIFYRQLGYFTDGIFYDHLVHFFPVWVIFTKKNLATLVGG